MILMSFIFCLDEKYQTIRFHRVFEEDKAQFEPSDPGSIYSLEQGLWRHHSVKHYLQWNQVLPKEQLVQTTGKQPEFTGLYRSFKHLH